MKNQNKRAYMLIFLIAVLSLSSGCAIVNKKHPQIVSDKIKLDSNVKFASVYFIRPRLYKTKGVADKPVRVEFQEKTLLTIDEGSYTLLRIKPSKGQLIVFNETLFINKSTPIEVWRARQYKFIAGKTYFIHLQRIDEEFRGIFYDPEPVNLKSAKTLLENVIATGLANETPIDKLTEVSEPPASATDKLPPALPENIYKR